MTLAELINEAWVQSLGWTLLNSLWQGLAIMLLLLTALRFISIRKSEVRYIVSYAALFLLLVASVFTFVKLLPTASNSNEPFSQTVIALEQITRTDTTSISFLSSILSFLQLHMDVWISLWFIGSLIFIIRIMGGWFYIARLRRDSISIGDSWNKKVLDLSYQLGIKLYVSICESDKISVPIVIGFFKPLILLPVGMLSGLSAEQMETILVHELMHVRRNDYVFNLIQSFIEAIFFFNPFVWIISSIVRTEREHCCDDAVVRFHGDAVTYVHALSRLEEVRVTKPTLALSLTNNKHYLLIRIKRLMEKSMVKYPVREKVLPLVVLVIGLMCASWITIKSSEDKKEEKQKNETAIADTTKKKKTEKSARSVRKSVITIDENGTPTEQVTETFEDDEEMRPFMMMPHAPEPAEFDAFAFEPNIPDFEMMMPPMLDMNQSTFDFTFDSTFDTLQPNMDNFSAEFEKMFSERFGEFYKDHEEELTKMMEELNEKMQDTRIDGFNFRQKMHINKAQMEAHAEQIKAMNIEKHHEQMQVHMHKMQMEQEGRMQKMNEHMREMEKNMKVFEGELQDQLIKDGYLKKDEKIKKINFNDEGDIEVNGKKVKEKDKAKYKTIQEKFHGKEKRIKIVE